MAPGAPAMAPVTFGESEEPAAEYVPELRSSSPIGPSSVVRCVVSIVLIGSSFPARMARAKSRDVIRDATGKVNLIIRTLRISENFREKNGLARRVRHARNSDRSDRRASGER